MESLQEKYSALENLTYFPYFDIKKQYEMRDLTREELCVAFAKERTAVTPYMNKYENLFVKIPNFEEKLFYMNHKSDHIVIQEKIDGSNAHLNVDGQSFQCCGNRYILNERNHLQGFWYWCRDHYKQVPKEYFGLDIYGEWLVPHHCWYPAQRYGEFYVFDVMEHGEYWPQDRVRKLAGDCGFTYIPVFYSGPFISWSHALSFVGRTDLGGTKGEGIVLKNQTMLNCAGNPFYVKIVDEEFQETNQSRQMVKTVNLEKILEMENQRVLSESIVTVPRVRKAIQKLTDMHELPVDWEILEERELLKIVKPFIFKDCVDEEKETVEKIGKSFGRYCNELTLRAIQSMRKKDVPD